MTYQCKYHGKICSEPIQVVYLWGCWTCDHYLERFYCRNHYERDHDARRLPKSLCATCGEPTGLWLTQMIKMKK